MTELDKFFPPAGPCGICGGPDKRHRLGDSLFGMWRAGDSIHSIAVNFDLKHRAVIANNAAYESARRGHRRMPFQVPLTDPE